MKRNKKGFTIIELVIVIAVVGVLTAVLVPVFINLTNKANEAADQSLVKNLNTALKAEEQLFGNKKNETLQDAIDDLVEEGYILENLISKSGQDLIWSQSKNEFVLNKDNLYSGADYWQIVRKVPEYGQQKYSYYAGKQFDNTVSDLKFGFDAGYNEDALSLNYIGNGGVAQTVAFRTNAGSLTINAGSDTVKHFGTASVANLTAVSPNSYYEHGSVNQINIKKGRLVLTNTEESKVNTVYLEKTEDAYDGIILATQSGAELPSFIARDSVNEPESGEKLVVTIQTNVDEKGEQPEKTEFIYLYPAKDVKEGTNGYDVSNLGVLVVEAISDEAKEEAAEEITNPEVLEQVKSPKSDCTAVVDSIGYATFSSALSAATNKTMILLKDVEMAAIQIYQKVTIDLNGHNLTLRGHANAGTTGGAIWIDGGGQWGNGILTILNGELNMPGTNFATYGIYNYGTLTLKNLTVNSACDTVIYVNGQDWGTTGTTLLDNVTINSTKSTGVAFAAYSLKSNFNGTYKPVVSIKNSNINSAKDGVMIYATDATVDNTVITATNNVLWISKSAMASGVTGTLTVQGDTTLNGGSDYSRLHTQDDNVISIVAGTYNFNPTAYVNTTIYDVIASGNVWTVSAK